MEFAGKRQLVLLLGMLSLQAGFPLRTAADELIEFNRDVRPILSENCFFCHGQDQNKRQADLRLDTPDGQRSSAAVVPGKPDQSVLIERIESRDPAFRMPPPDSNHDLTESERQILRRWIAEGATFQQHWSLVPPIRPVVPAYDWPTQIAVNPIDHFVLQTLAEKGLQPAAEADRATLIRRVSFDLTGLPPTPDEVDAFLTDQSPDAYEKVVDRLLASPHFGERMAVPWLDAARYADTHGYQKDNIRTMWAWRDWVVEAFNRNLPFDQFTIEQLAGDLLPDPSVEQRIATGFHRNHRINAEAGAIEEEFRVEYAADRVDTTGTVWLGMTIGCARCHDHKFDPISQKEYYQLFAFFNSIDEKGVDGVEASPSPNLVVELTDYRHDISRVQGRLRNHQRRLEQAAAALSGPKAEWERQLAALVGGFSANSSAASAVDNSDGRGNLSPTAVFPELSSDRDGQSGSRYWCVVDYAEVESTQMMRFSTLPDHSILASGPNPLNDVHTITFPRSEGRMAALRLEVLSHETHTNNGFARSFDGTFVLSGVDIALIDRDGTARELPVRQVIADSSSDNWPADAVLDESTDTGWSAKADSQTARAQAVFVLERPVRIGPDMRCRVRLRYESKEEQTIIGRFRVATTDSVPTTEPSLPDVPAALVVSLRTSPADRTQQQLDTIEQEFRRQAPELADWRDQITADRKLLDQLEQQSTTSVMVMREVSPKRDTFVLLRGAYDNRGEKVSAAVPVSLSQFAAGGAGSRLDLARWIVHRENPLTARVAVNRYWQQYFGRGLVETTEDFGSQGAWPDHPQLLDWLAVEFMESDWNIKSIQRLIVTSATYRRSSVRTPELMAQDPDNRWLARGPRFRLSAQMLRDQALAVSGLLRRKLAGPPVRPYQPEGLWEGVAGINSNTVRYEQDHGENLYRRSLYTFWKRAVPPPSMMIFDASNREVCSVGRQLTNTPLQALNLLNDVTYLEAARVLAEEVLAVEGLNRKERLRLLWRRVLSRHPDAKELNRLSAAVDRYRAWFEESPEDARRLLQVGEYRTAARSTTSTAAGTGTGTKHSTPTPPTTGRAVETAAWTMLTSMLLNLDEAITKE